METDLEAAARATSALEGHNDATRQESQQILIFCRDDGQENAFEVYFAIPAVTLFAVASLVWLLARGKESLSMATSCTLLATLPLLTSMFFAASEVASGLRTMSRSSAEPKLTEFAWLADVALGSLLSGLGWTILCIIIAAFGLARRAVARQE